MASSQISPLNIDNICGLKSVNNSQVYFEPYQKMINVRQNLVEPGPGQDGSKHVTDTFLAGDLPW